jgi:hypothetical protein
LKVIRAGLPQDIFRGGEEIVSSHLAACSDCRSALIDEIEYIFQYNDIFRTIEESAVYEVAQSRAFGAIELLPRRDSAAMPMFAARTVDSGREPFPFESDEPPERMIIFSRIPDTKSGCYRYYLGSEQPQRYRHAVVLIGSESYECDENGFIDFGDIEPAIDFNTRIFVIPEGGREPEP